MRLLPSLRVNADPPREIDGRPWDAIMRAAKPVRGSGRITRSRDSPGAGEFGVTMLYGG